MKFNLIIVILACSLHCSCQHIPKNSVHRNNDSTQDVIHKFLPADAILLNTFNIQADSGFGTCFQVIFDKNPYVVTVKHLFKTGHKAGDNIIIAIRANGKIEVDTINYYPHPNKNVDLAILHFPRPLNNMFPPPADSLVGLGTDVRLFGFPIANLGTQIGNNYIPILKKGMISGFFVDSFLVNHILIDGHVNHGFSGGPAIAQYANGNQFIFGVIVGFLNEDQSISSRILNQSNQTATIKDIDSLILRQNSGLVSILSIAYLGQIIQYYKKSPH